MNVFMAMVAVVLVRYVFDVGSVINDGFNDHRNALSTADAGRCDPVATAATCNSCASVSTWARARRRQGCPKPSGPR